ncbi:hypothetical protein C4K27_1766 [Pseudomonas chlororaphis subsp. chlororaphis]|nr:hypothetical protein C4K27_1766 [Pseudomonas chlororaphis subsp. chlororaphis]
MTTGLLPKCHGTAQKTIKAGQSRIGGNSRQTIHFAADC